MVCYEVPEFHGAANSNREPPPVSGAPPTAIPYFMPSYARNSPVPIMVPVITSFFDGQFGFLPPLGLYFIFRSFFSGPPARGFVCLSYVDGRIFLCPCPASSTLSPSDESSSAGTGIQVWLTVE